MQVRACVKMLLEARGETRKGKGFSCLQLNKGVGEVHRTLANSELKGSIGSREQEAAGDLGSICGGVTLKDTR